MAVQTLSLNGAWQLYKQGQGDPIPACVPGCVHTDLLAANLIPDPYYRDNELAVLWVGETDWTYRRTFEVPADLLKNRNLWLRCKGLDTIAHVRLNGRELGYADNMFREWSFDIKGVLRSGQNQIEIAFSSPMQYVRAKNASSRYLPAWGVGDHKLDSGGWIRKEPCNFGWDWGPELATSGIWRDIEIVAWNTARLEDVETRQTHHTDGSVSLEVSAQAALSTSDTVQARFTLTLEGKAIASGSTTLQDGKAQATLMVKCPALWWPNGMGAQPLYDLTVSLLDNGGVELDSTCKRIGLRTLELVRQADAYGQSFHFAANGVPFFAKGANWIPDDVFAASMTRERYRRSLQDAVDANMNMLRVWGGGLYEQDDFYDLCDELGLCVWQDFIFACATYPTFDADWMANVREEAEQNVRRIRHHASLALWCGNNEMEQGLVGEEWTDHCMSWADYIPLYDEMLAEIVARLDPQTAYWPSSPHTPCGDRRDFNNPDCGDAHLWSVWHGKMPFEWYRTCEHRFNSEFGFQSFPEPRTTHSYTRPGDRNITSAVMEHHQRSGIGNTTIMSYMCDWFRLPSSFDNTLWLSQILQGMAIKYAVEHWRRAMPRGMGTLYWQINDCWPVASWSSVDSLGRWKALHYMARNFYAPLLVSGVEDPATGSVELHVTSDLGEEVPGVVSWRVTNVRGETLITGAEPLNVPPRANTLVTTLDLANLLEASGPRGLLLWLELNSGGAIVSRNMVTFARPKHMALEQPGLCAAVEDRHDGSFTVTLKADRPALWAWISLATADARYSDNFVHVVPGQPIEIIVTPCQPMSAEALESQLELRSLFDTYEA
ncbi:MAG: beta-mannosidase [Anaerolineae bacterium]|jgi:beta-mannosidase|nr:glycoside hydrolase family 2 protein [Chloroflexota bacterium]